jgi:hypothetical protein
MASAAGHALNGISAAVISAALFGPFALGDA